MRRNTKGLWAAGVRGWSIRAMDSTIHTFLAAQYVQDRTARATSERAARELKRKRAWTRQSRREAAAGRGRPVAAPRATATSS